MITAVERVIAGGVSSAQRRVDPPLAFIRAAGAYLHDAEGRRYIDYHAAFGPALLGHCHPEVNASVAGFGSVFALHFQSGPIDGYDDLRRNDDAADLAFRRGLIERGVYLLPVPLKRGHIGLAHTEGDIDATLEAAAAALRAARDRPGADRPR